MSNLTIKQRKLVAGVAAGLPKRQAAIQAGYSERSAHSVAHETLNSPEVLKSLNEIMQEQGITDSYIGFKLLELVEAESNGQPHWPTRARALDMLLKVKGYYSPDVQAPQTEVTIEQLNAKIMAILTS